MDVVFINGGVKTVTISRSIGPYKIAHWIRKHGYSCQVIDFAHFYQQEELFLLLNKFVNKDTKVLGISTTFLCNSLYRWKDGSIARMKEDIVLAIRTIKKMYPDLKVILGGYMSEHVSGWSITNATIMSYTNSVEDIFLEYLNHLTLGTTPPKSEKIMTKFKGTMRTVFYEANVKKYNIEEDDFKFIEQDCVLPNEPLPLDTSKGCIFQCKFCQYHHTGKKKLDYIRGMDFLKEELIHNYNSFGTTAYYMLDDTFNDSVEKVSSFNNMVKSLPFKITFAAYLRADLIHRFQDTAYMLQESGLVGAYHGIETLHPEASRVIGKAWSGKHARDYIPKLFHEQWGGKITQHTNFIIGLTHDTRKNIQSTLDWYKDNNLHSIKFDRLNLYGGGNTVSRYSVQSEFDKNPQEYGYTLTDEYTDAGRYWYNDNWNVKTASSLTTDMNKLLEGITKPNVFQTVGFAWYGIEIDKILNMAKTDLDFVSLSRKGNEFIDLYKTKLLNL